MVELSQLELTGFTTILSGFIFLATGILLFLNASNTVADSVSPEILRLLGAFTALVGVLLLVSRDD
jgi:hypothetical protein